jgi:hypothetical protein
MYLSCGALAPLDTYGAPVVMAAECFLSQQKMLSLGGATTILRQLRYSEAAVAAR